MERLLLSSKNASTSDRVQRLERRINGLKHSLSELREENEELRSEIAALREFESRAGDQLIDLHERLEDHRDQFRQIKVNENRIEDLYLRSESKVGVSAFNVMEERVRQIRAQLGFLADAMEVDREELPQRSLDRAEV